MNRAFLYFSLIICAATQLNILSMGDQCFSNTTLASIPSRTLTGGLASLVNPYSRANNNSFYVSQFNNLGGNRRVRRARGERKKELTVAQKAQKLNDKIDQHFEPQMTQQDFDLLSSTCPNDLPKKKKFLSFLMTHLDSYIKTTKDKQEISLLAKKNKFFARVINEFVHNYDLRDATLMCWQDDKVCGCLSPLFSEYMLEYATETYKKSADDQQFVNDESGADEAKDAGLLVACGVLLAYGGWPLAVLYGCLELLG